MRLKLIPATTLVVTAAALVGAVAPAAAQSVQLVPFGGQTFSLPKYVTGAPGDPSRVFVVERDGTIRLSRTASPRLPPSWISAATSAPTSTAGKSRGSPH